MVPGADIVHRSLTEENSAALDSVKLKLDNLLCLCFGFWAVAPVRVSGSVRHGVLERATPAALLEGFLKTLEALTNSLQ